MAFDQMGMRPRFATPTPAPTLMKHPAHTQGRAQTSNHPRLITLHSFAHTRTHVVSIIKSEGMSCTGSCATFHFVYHDLCPSSRQSFALPSHTGPQWALYCTRCTYSIYCTSSAPSCPHPKTHHHTVVPPSDATDKGPHRMKLIMEVGRNTQYCTRTQCLEGIMKQPPKWG